MCDKDKEDNLTMKTNCDSNYLGLVGKFIGPQAPNIKHEQVPNFKLFSDGIPLGQVVNWGLKDSKLRAAHLSSFNGDVRRVPEICDKGKSDEGNRL